MSSIITTTPTLRLIYLLLPPSFPNCNPARLPPDILSSCLQSTYPGYSGSASYEHCQLVSVYRSILVAGEKLRAARARLIVQAARPPSKAAQLSSRAPGPPPRLAPPSFSVSPLSQVCAYFFHFPQHVATPPLLAVIFTGKLQVEPAPQQAFRGRRVAAKTSEKKATLEESTKPRLVSAVDSHRLT
ncbi:hypothetical protein TMatcc_008843 [Talaromyces marneffei ATCC 18224]